jgi:Carboxypeptidase regulatory-like domain/TonB-dependent Receptor Plug Domain/TonB dependent receptor
MKCFCLIFLLLALPVSAQVGTASMMGSVEDSTGAALPDADLKLVNSQTGTENVSRTSGDGRFILPGVLPGAYSLQIERSGFATTQLSGIILNVGDTKNLLIRLKVGATTESVNVDASGLTLNTTDGSVSTVVDRRFVSSIPLNGRSFQDLISMTPGIVTQNPQASGQQSDPQGDFSVNGQRVDANSFYVDGVSANTNLGLTANGSSIASTGSTAGSTALGTTQSLVSVDALQEFRVLSSTYSAEYGRSPGGQFNFLTRSGTSDIHGSLYTYWRGSVFDASDWFSAYYGSSNQYRVYSQNNFGGTLGMPIRLYGRDHHGDSTFLFLSHEGLLLTQHPPPRFDFVPSDAVHIQANRAAPFLDYFPFPLGQSEIKDAEGEPTGLTALGYWNTDALPALLNSTNVRLDQTFSPKLSAFVRYGVTPSDSQAMRFTSLTTGHVRTETFTLGVAAQVTTKTSDDFRLGFANTRSNTDTTAPIWQSVSGNPDHTLGDTLGLLNFSGSTSAEAFIRVPGVGGTSVNTDTAIGALTQWNVRNTFSLQIASHLLRLGFDERYVTSAVNPATISVQADFFDRQSMVDGVASDVAITRSEPARPVLNQFSAFAQDEWRVSKALTLSLGLRWEVNPPPTGKQGLDAYTAIGDVTSPSTLRVAPRGTPLWHTGWSNFAPRFGAAWMIDDQGDWETILRIGAGVFFDTGNQPALQAFRAAGFTQTRFLQNAPLPVTSAQLEFPSATTAPFSNSTVFVFPSHLQLPYSIQWDIALEKALGRNQAFTISYVGSYGSRLLQEQRRNISQVNSDFGNVSFFPNGITSNYQSLQTKFQRTITHGVQGLASYTWAHSLDYGSTDPAYPLTYGNSDFDVRHNLEGALSWDLPGPRNTWLKYLLGSWGLDGRLIARTAFPVTLNGNLFSDPITGHRYYNGVDLIPNRPRYLYGASYPGGKIINGGPSATDPAFALPEGAEAGNAPRDFVRGFNAVQANLGIRREMPIYDRVKVELRADTFNFLNHPNFGYIDPALTDALFGQSTRMLNQSFGPNGSIYQQGGPRSIQFSFKLIF